MFGYPVAGASVPATGAPEGVSMLKEYDVVMNGTRTTMQLDEINARRLGVWVDDSPAVEVKQAEPKPNKARKPRNKGGDDDGSRS